MAFEQLCERKEKSFEKQLQNVTNEFFTKATQKNKLSNMTIACLYFKNFESRWKVNIQEEKVIQQERMNILRELIKTEDLGVHVGLFTERNSEPKKTEFQKLRRKLKNSNNFESATSEFWKSSERLYTDYSGYNSKLE